MKKILIITPIILLLAGCAATTLRLPVTSINQLSGKQLHVVSTAPNNMFTLKAKYAMMGVVGGLAAIKEAKSFHAAYGFKNPAKPLASDLSRFLVGKFRLSGVGQRFDLPQGAKPSDIKVWAKKKKLKGLLLEVNTVIWGYIYHNFQYSSYKVVYAVEVKLRDLQKNKVIASHTCDVNTKKHLQKELVGFEVLIADNAAYTKQNFTALSRLCATEVKTKIL